MKCQQELLFAKLKVDIAVANRAQSEIQVSPTLGSHSSIPETTCQARWSGMDETLSGRSESKESNIPFSDRPSFERTSQVPASIDEADLVDGEDSSDGRRLSWEIVDEEDSPLP